MKQILTEFISPEKRPLSVDNENNDGKSLWMRGIALQAECENQNGRIYSLNEITKACESLAQRITTYGGVLGECDHPSDLMITTKNVSHVIKEVWMDGNNGCVKMRIIDEGCGKIVRGIIEAGGVLGVSSRGSGSVDNKGHVSDYEIVTIDIVVNPSARLAYPTPIWESLLHSHNGRELSYLAAIKEDKAAQKYFEKSLKAYLMEIRDQVLWNKK